MPGEDERDAVEETRPMTKSQTHHEEVMAGLMDLLKTQQVMEVARDRRVEEKDAECRCWEEESER